jgi:hypothetical protein
MGPDALIWFGRNLRLEGYLALLQDDTLREHPISFSSAAVYDQDLWEASLRTQHVDEDFNPAMGFVRRRGFYRQHAKLRRGWRLNRDWARKVDLSGEAVYLTDQQGRLETRQWLLGVSNELDSGDRILFQLEQNFERLFADDEPFVINPVQGLIIPPGDYAFNRWLLGYQSFEGRSLVAKAQFEQGQFFGGHRRRFTLSGTWYASPHFLLSGDYEFNDIELAQGAFASHLGRVRFSIPWNGRTITDAFLQWNGQSEEFNTQLRLHLIYGRDSDLFLVFTDNRTGAGGIHDERSWAVQMKLDYRLYW